MVNQVCRNPLIPLSINRLHFFPNNRIIPHPLRTSIRVCWHGQLKAVAHLGVGFHLGDRASVASHALAMYSTASGYGMGGQQHQQMPQQQMPQQQMMQQQMPQQQQHQNWGGVGDQGYGAQQQGYSTQAHGQPQQQQQWVSMQQQQPMQQPQQQQPQQMQQPQQQSWGLQGGDSGFQT